VASTEKTKSRKTETATDKITQNPKSGTTPEMTLTTLDCRSAHLALRRQLLMITTPHQQQQPLRTLASKPAPLAETEKKSLPRRQ